MSFSSWMVSGVFSSFASSSSPLMWPTCVAIPIEVATRVPAPRVTCEFMNAMSSRSPRAASAATTPVCFGTGELSPVNADSSISSVAAVRIRPSAGHDVACLDRDDVAGDDVLHRDHHQLAVPPDLRLGDHHLPEGRDTGGRLALLVQPHRRVEQGDPDQDDGGFQLMWQEEADDAGDEEHDLHQIAVLAEECPPARLDGRRGELVRSETCDVGRPLRRSSGLRSPSTPWAVRASSVVRACQSGSGPAVAATLSIMPLPMRSDGEDRSTHPSAHHEPTSRPMLRPTDDTDGRARSSVIRRAWYTCPEHGSRTSDGRDLRVGCRTGSGFRRSRAHDLPGLSQRGLPPPRQVRQELQPLLHPVGHVRLGRVPRLPGLPQRAPARPGQARGGRQSCGPTRRRFVAGR